MYHISRYVIADEYGADPTLEQTLLVETKAVTALNEGYNAQCIDYLKASDPPPGLRLNFGTKRLEIKRVASTV